MRRGFKIKKPTVFCALILAILVFSIGQKLYAQTSSQSYFVGIDGKAAGPYDINALKELIQNGSLTITSLVWKEGMTDWAEASAVPEVSSLFTPVPLSPPQQYDLTRDEDEYGNSLRLVSVTPKENVRNNSVVRFTVVVEYNLVAYYDRADLVLFEIRFEEIIGPVHFELDRINIGERSGTHTFTADIMTTYWEDYKGFRIAVWMTLPNSLLSVRQDILVLE